MYFLSLSLNQPRTQALHCFYRDQWQLIDAKRAKVLGQHAKKPSAQLIASELYKNNGAPGYEAVLKYILSTI